MSDPIAEISEADATGAIAEIYRDIKAVTGVGQVNTIWRHWASLPPALAWAWGAVRPLYDDGRVAAAAEALVVSVDISDSAEVPMEAFRAAGVGDHAVGTAAAIVEAYNRANSQNLVAMPALARFIADGGAEKRRPRPIRARGRKVPARCRRSCRWMRWRKTRPRWSRR